MVERRRRRGEIGRHCSGALDIGEPRPDETRITGAAPAIVRSAGCLREPLLSASLGCGRVAGPLPPRSLRSGARPGIDDHRRPVSSPQVLPFPNSPDPPPQRPRISIVVNNYNYERFLAEAIESSLSQSGDVEVLVVDDGSTDGSRAVIERYDVRAIFQENQGQKSAFNAGLANATGDVILFLDADDVLEPGIAEDVADAFAAQPNAVRVIYRLGVIDSKGRPTGAHVPSTAVALPSGDLRVSVLSFADDLAWPPTSGNAFAAWALRRFMPLPRDDDAIGADSILHPLVPMLGPVVALDRVGGRYRLHGGNAHFRDRTDIERSRVILRQTRQAHVWLDRLARELGYDGARPESVTVAAHRLISLRLGGAGHPIAGDNRWAAVRAGLRAARGRKDVGWLRRGAYAAWFLAAATLPRRTFRALADVSFQPVRTPSPLQRIARR
jgi:glycosyltransferase involved in cell wall biosynthesis